MADDRLTLREIPRRVKPVVLDNRPSPWPLAPDAAASTAVGPGDFVAAIEPGSPRGRAAAKGHPRKPVPAATRPRVREATRGNGQAVVSHAADRLARAIVQATQSAGDLRTLNAWGLQIGVSRGALRVWCTAAGVSARASLDFLRLLRAVVRSEGQAWDLFSILDVVDQRTLIQLLDRGSVRELCRHTRPSTEEFLITQRYLLNEPVVLAVSRWLREG